MDLDDKNASVWAVAIVFATLSWLTVGLRVYVRAVHIGKFGLDDKLVIVAQVFFTAYLVCQMGGAAYGTGRHMAVLSRDNATTALQFWFFCEVWYALATSTVKVAICSSLLRVTIKPVHRVIIYGLIIWSIALGIAIFLVVVFQCHPTSDWWDLGHDHYSSCISPRTITSLTYTASAFNVACDWTLGIFPFFIVKDLSIPIYQKIMVASILAFGAIASTATIVRLFYIPALEQIYDGWNGDFLYDTTPVAVWTTVEVGIGITAICLSTLRPLVSKVLWFLGTANYTSYGHAYPSTRLSDDSHSHIPLSGTAAAAPGTASTSTTFDSMAATQFNITKPLSSRRYDPRHIYDKTSPPPSQFTFNTQFNTTKALTSSQSEIEEDEFYRAESSTVRRHGPG